MADLQGTTRLRRSIRFDHGQRLAESEDPIEQLADLKARSIRLSEQLAKVQDQLRASVGHSPVAGTGSVCAEIRGIHQQQAAERQRGAFGCSDRVVSAPVRRYEPLSQGSARSCTSRDFHRESPRRTRCA